MRTKYSHLSDTELLALRFMPVTQSSDPLVEELFNRLQTKIVDAPETKYVTPKYMGEAR